MMSQNDELTGLLYENLARVDFNRYNVEVFSAVAALCRQNLSMLADLAQMDQLLTMASEAARKQQPRQAVTGVDRALEIAARIRRERNRVLEDATATWYKSWLPRVAEANGRRFLHELDDVKDHLPDRTVDMSYLVWRELLLPFGEWVEKIQSARNAYAQRNQLPARSVRFDWRDLRADN
jgi:hypothetical protein